MAEVDPTKRSAPLVKLALLGLLVAVVYVIATRTMLGTHLTREGIQDGMAWLRGHPGAPLIFIAAYTGATAVGVPGTVLTLAGGGLFGPIWGTVFNYAAANLGANAAFVLARFLGRDGVRTLLRLRSEALARMDLAVERHGFRGILVLRLIPAVPFNALNFGAGLLSLRWRSYALATLVGILPGTAIYTFFADALLQGSLETSRTAALRLLIAGALVLSLSALPRMLKRLRNRPSVGGGAMFTLALCLPLATLAHGQAQAPATQLAPLVDHGTFTTVLRSVTQGSGVDYARLAAAPEELYAYLDDLARVDSAAIGQAHRDDKLAFWINAYNACMLKRVIEHYPIQRSRGLRRLGNIAFRRPANSVWQIPDVFTEPHCLVAGEVHSQDGIEHDIVRPIGEPRIHFAINCAAASCPPLLPRAYEGHVLDDQLDARVRAFMDDSTHFAVERGEHGVVVRLNRVLEWFSDDFGGIEGLRRFLAGYATGPIRAAILGEDTVLEFFDYDWTLNDIAGS